MRFEIPRIVYAALSRSLEGVPVSDEPFLLRFIGDSFLLESFALRLCCTDNKHGDLR